MKQIAGYQFYKLRFLINHANWIDNLNMDFPVFIDTQQLWAHLATWACSGLT